MVRLTGFAEVVVRRVMMRAAVRSFISDWLWSVKKGSHKQKQSQTRNMTLSEAVAMNI